MAIVIQGFSSTEKVPGFYGETVFHAGALTAASIPLILLLCGLKTDSGTMTVDEDVVDIFSADDADTYAGAGSELALMCYGALNVSGVKIKACSPAIPGSPTQATATITIAGSWTAAGQYLYRIGGVTITGAYLSSDDATAVATKIAAAVNANTRCGASATSSLGVVTLTWKTKTVRGNIAVLAQDKTDLASGMTSTLAGGTALTGGYVPFSSGAGADDVTNILGVIYSARYDRIAHAQIDTTNLGKWKTQLDSKAGPNEGRMEMSIFATNGTLSAAASLAGTTCNEPRMQCLHLLNGESYPPIIAATFAALRTQYEQDNRNASFDGVTIPGIAPQVQIADRPSHSVQSTALDEGVTELTTDSSGNVVVVRSITTYTLNGSTPDYRTLDTAQVVVPDYVRDYDKLVWLTQFVVANPYVRDDPGANEPEPKAGVATPKRWTQQLGKNTADLVALNYLSSAVDPPVSEFNAAAGRIMSIHPVVPLPQQHSIGVSVRQLNAA